MNLHFFSQAEFDFTINLIFCLVSGLVIGGEREWRSKDAGISTHVLVITGAMLFTFMSATVDPASRSRIAAQVVSGIGFLGAGLILKEGTSVKNLTTAASLWVSASIGMAYGFGFHMVGLLATIVTALAPRLPHLRRWTRKKKDDGG